MKIHNATCSSTTCRWCFLELKTNRAKPTKKALFECFVMGGKWRFLVSWEVAGPSSSNDPSIRDMMSVGLVWMEEAKCLYMFCPYIHVCHIAGSLVGLTDWRQTDGWMDDAMMTVPSEYYRNPADVVSSSRCRRTQARHISQLCRHPERTTHHIIYWRLVPLCDIPGPRSQCEKCCSLFFFCPVLFPTRIYSFSLLLDKSVKEYWWCCLSIVGSRADPANMLWVGVYGIYREADATSISSIPKRMYTIYKPYVWILVWVIRMGVGWTKLSATSCNVIFIENLGLSMTISTYIQSKARTAHILCLYGGKSCWIGNESAKMMTLRWQSNFYSYIRDSGIAIKYGVMEFNLEFNGNKLFKKKIIRFTQAIFQPTSHPKGNSVWRLIGQTTLFCPISSFFSLLHDWIIMRTNPGVGRNFRL